MMKALQVIHQDPRQGLGGSETYCRHLIREMRHKGVEVGVFHRASVRQIQPLSIQHENGVRHYNVDLQALPTATDRFQYTNSFANPEVLKQFIQVLEDFRPDIVHLQHLITLSVDLIHACNKLNIPVVATLHDYWYFCHHITLTLPDGSRCPGPSGGLACRGCGKPMYNHFPGKLLQPGQALAAIKRNRRLIAGLNACHILYAPSHSLMSRYEKQGVSTELLQHRPYGIAPVRRKKRSGNGMVTFGYIGNLSSHKGIEVLIQSMHSLNGGLQRLVVYGSGKKNYEEKLHQMAQGSPVEFKGRFDASDLSSAMAGMDVLVVPSLWEENSPLVVREARAAGLRLVASRRGGIAELAPDARLVEPRELHRALAAEVRLGRRRAPAAHWPRLSEHADRMLRFYEDCIQRARSP